MKIEYELFELFVQEMMKSMVLAVGELNVEHIIQHHFYAEGLSPTGLARAFSMCNNITFNLHGLA
jgi:hypothetical protein